MPDRPNILFLTTDHQRADSLGMSQAGVEVCPALNRLAAEGAAFTRAYTTCPLCVPARTAMATGLYPTRNGVVFNDWPGARAGDHKPIHQYLAEGGYDVAHVGRHHVRLRPPLEDRAGFVQWISNAEYARFLDEAGIDEAGVDLSAFRREVSELQDGRRVRVAYSSTRVAVWPHPLEYFKDVYLCRRAEAFLRERRGGGPFALFLELRAPHPPLRVPQPYASLFDPGRIDLPANVGVPADGEPPGRRSGMPAQLAEGVCLDEWRKVWAAHLGLVRLAADGLGAVLQALRDAGHTGNTVVVFTSDHGDLLGQHAMYQKMEMYEPAIRVPLIVRSPRVRAGTHDVPVSHLDVLPTLLDLAGLPVPDGLDGASLRETLVSGSPPEPRPVFCQYSGNPTVGDIRRAVIDGPHKYVYDPADQAELYDLAADPLEMTNLAPAGSHQTTRQRLHRLSAAWAAKHDDWIDL